MRFARLDFYRATPGPVAITPAEVNVEVVRLDPAMDVIVGPNPKIFKLAEGFQFTEGPIWMRDGEYLVFSDPNANTQYKYTSDGQLSVSGARAAIPEPTLQSTASPGQTGSPWTPRAG